MKPSIFEIFKIYFLIGLQLIGGGYVILPLLKKYLVDDKKWMQEEELIDYLALSQCLPGIIALNISIFSGYALLKLKGALSATFGLLLPSFIIILLVASFVFNIADNKIVQDAFFGIRLSIIVLIFFMVYDIYKKSIKTNFANFLFLGVLLGCVCTKLTPTMLVVASILAAILRGRKNA